MVIKKSKPKRFTLEEMKHMQRLANRGNIGAIRRQVEHMNHLKGMEHAFVHAPRSGRLVTIPNKQGLTLDGRPSLDVKSRTKSRFAKKYKTFIHTHPNAIINNGPRLLITPSLGDLVSFLKEPFQNNAIFIMDKNKIAATVVLKKTKRFLAISKNKQKNLATDLEIYLYKIASLSKLHTKRVAGYEITGVDAGQEYLIQGEIDHLVRTGSTKRFGFVARIVPAKGYGIKQNKYGDTVAFKK